MTPESTLGALISIGIGVALIFLGKNLRMFAAAVGLLLGLQLVALFNGGLLLGLLVGGMLAIGGIILLRLGKTFIGLIVQLIGAAAGAAILLWLLSLQSGWTWACSATSSLPASALSAASS